MKVQILTCEAPSSPPDGDDLHGAVPKFFPLWEGYIEGSHSAAPKPLILRWCGRRGSNPHDFRHGNLNPARLPVPPRPRPEERPGGAAYIMRNRAEHIEK